MKRWLVSLFAMVMLTGLVACGGEDGSQDASVDTSLPDVVDVADVPGDPDSVDIQDVTTPDIPKPDVVGDAVEDMSEDVPMVLKHFTYRTVAGMSMGAMALTVAAHYPDWFDSAGGMGGYIDFRYLAHVMRNYMAGGFCPMEQLLRPEVLADINNPDNPLVFCGTDVKAQPWEFYWDFNHFNFGSQGGTWGRRFYIEVLESMSFAYGNIMNYNPDHPLLPPGVPASELLRSDSDRCANPVKVGKPYNYNAEYNPEGEFDLVGFCDGDTPVGCYEGDPKKCGKANPDYEKILVWRDPDHDYKIPVSMILTVDYNKNGKRDYGEPIIINLSERWDDWGVDGCPDNREDGEGGCIGEPDPNYIEGTDPNNDNFDLLENPGGTEGNYEYDEGELFLDYGIDGVPESVSGFKDHGEGDGEFNYNPNLERMIKSDTRSFFQKAPLELLKSKEYYFDGGIRDSLHALTHKVHTSNALKLRGIDVKRYMHFGGYPQSIMPDVDCSDVLHHMEDIDWSRRSFGEAVVMGYGEPDASPSSASGGHVGSGCEVSLRAGILYSMTMARMPNALWVNDWDFGGRIEFRSHYSDTLGMRRWYAVNLPPGYDSPDFMDTRYPMGLILPGVGMPLMETIGITAIMNLTWGYGTTPRFILVAPDGQCCYRQDSTGERFCNCYRDGEEFTCVEPQCKGRHEDCEIYKISRSGMTQECNSGHFFVNQVTNRWGEELGLGTDSNFEDALFETIRAVEEDYRIRPPEDVLVPANFPDVVPKPVFPD